MVECPFFTTIGVKLVSYNEILFDLKPYAIHPKIQKICDEWQLFLNESSQTQKHDRAGSIRTKLLEIENDDSFNVLNRSHLMSIVSRALDQMSMDFPINQEDPITLEPLANLPSNQVLGLSTGHHFHVPSLIEQFNHARQDILTFENPVTRTRIPFRDGLRIQRLAEEQGLRLTANAMSVNFYENSTRFRNLLSYLQEMSPQQIGRVMNSWNDLYQICQNIQSKFMALLLCYGLQYGTQYYFSSLNSVPVEQTEQDQISFVLFTGLPSWMILSLMQFIKQTAPCAESQSNYFYYLFLMHGVAELSMALFGNTDLDDAKFCLRYLLVWLITAQLTFPRQTNKIQTHYENLLSGVFSLCFEMYRHPDWKAHDFREYFTTPFFLEWMFNMPKIAVGLGFGFCLYEQIWNQNSRLFRSIQHLRDEYEHGIEEAPGLNRAPPSP